MSELRPPVLFSGQAPGLCSMDSQTHAGTGVYEKSSASHTLPFWKLPGQGVQIHPLGLPTIIIPRVPAMVGEGSSPILAFHLCPLGNEDFVITSSRDHMI